jgi:hypothetical protein
MLAGFGETFSESIEGHGVLCTGARRPRVSASTRSVGHLIKSTRVVTTHGLDALRNVARLVFAVTRLSIARWIARTHVHSLFHR